MNKQELIERMAGKTGMAKKDCGIALDGMLSAITEALQKDDKIKLTGFGTFEVKHGPPEQAAIRKPRRLWKFRRRAFRCLRRERS